MKSPQEKDCKHANCSFKRMPDETICSSAACRNFGCHTTNDGLDRVYRGSESWNHEHYRKIEWALNQFKKGRIGFSTFIESNADFISQLLQQQRDEIVKIAEGRKQPHQEISEYYSGYNTALSDLISTLTKKNI